MSPRKQTNKKPKKLTKKSLIKITKIMINRKIKNQNNKLQSQ